MKRFYTSVSTASVDGGFDILLDGRPVRTPGRRPLTVPTQALAEAIGEEWSAQEAEIASDQMPLTRLGATTIDLLPERRADAVAQLVDFGRTDLLCYRAEDPPTLIARQSASWDPPLTWLQERMGVSLQVTAGIIPLDQDEAEITALSAVVDRLDDWHLAALHCTTTTAGSVVLGLILVHGELGPEAVSEAATVDDRYAAERWGMLPEIADRHARLSREIAAADRWCRLLAE